MNLNVGIIGPTNTKKLSLLTGKPESFLLRKAEEVGVLLAEKGCEVWVNSDGGMVSAVALAYKNAGGGRLAVLYPKKGEPWPNTHAKEHIKYADELRKLPNWFWTNYEVVSAPQLVVCVGLSSGTLSELAYMKWNRQFNQGKAMCLAVVQELVRSKRIPPEIEVELKDILVYCKDMKSLERTIDGLQKK